MSARFELAAVCAAALTCGACSFVVGELDLQCTKPSDCNALNEEHGIDRDNDCFIYQCRSDGRGCEKRAKDLDNDKAFAPACDGLVAGSIDCDDDAAARTPGKMEICDEVDNDCDLVIDNGAFLQSPPPAPSSLFVGNRAFVHLSHASARDHSYVALTSHKGREFSTNIWRYDPLDPLPTFEGAEVVVSPGSTAACVDRQCQFLELVLSAGPDVFLTLGVDHSGCGAGQMRAGGAKGLYAPSKNSIVWATEVAACAEGASDASLALLVPPKGTPQALALWRAADDQTPGGGPLAGNGLWLDARGELPPDIRSTGGADPDIIPGSEGQDAAAVVAWSGRDQAGYFVAYETAQTVEFAFVPRLAGPQSPAMSSWLRAASLEETAPRQVALALDTLPASGVDQPQGLAAAWRTGKGEIHFVRISFDPDATPALSTEGPDTLQSGATIIEGPKVVYLPQGLGDGMSSLDRRTGGWFVTWLEQNGSDVRVVGVRVPERSTANQEPPFPIHQSQRLGYLFAYRANESTPGYGFIDPEASDGNQLHIGSLACPSID